MSRQAPASESSSALHDIARDEARFCAMLTRYITRLGDTPSQATGAFYGKLLRLGNLASALTRSNAFNAA
jgi:hypothetical protein